MLLNSLRIMYIIEDISEKLRRTVNTSFTISIMETKSMLLLTESAILIRHLRI